MQSIAAHTLPNGMLVLLCERHSAPIATCWVWYRVGSRYERRGETGISHWAEHMLFKGTPSVPASALKRLVARNGGSYNGFTAHDYTAYFTTLPADRIALALSIKADRMINAHFDPVVAQRERTVILAEREGRENDPTWWLNEAVLGAAFQVHPYRTTVIGRKRDLLALTRDAVYRHYQTYYQPNNAVLVLVGDFTTDTLLPQVEQSFARLPSGPAAIRALGGAGAGGGAAGGAALPQSGVVCPDRLPDAQLPAPRLRAAAGARWGAVGREAAVIYHRGAELPERPAAPRARRNTLGRIGAQSLLPHRRSAALRVASHRPGWAVARRGRSGADHRDRPDPAGRGRRCGAAEGADVDPRADRVCR